MFEWLRGQFKRETPTPVLPTRVPDRWLSRKTDAAPAATKRATREGDALKGGRLMGELAARTGDAKSGQRLLVRLCEEVNAITLPPGERSPKAWDKVRESGLTERVGALSPDDKLSILAYLGGAPGSSVGNKDYVYGKVTCPWDMAVYLAKSEPAADIDFTEAFSRIVPTMRDSAYGPPRYGMGPLPVLSGKEVTRLGVYAKVLEGSPAGIGPDSRATLDHLSVLLRSVSRVDDPARLAKLLERIDALRGTKLEDTPPLDPDAARQVAITPHPAAKVSDADLLAHVEKVNRISGELHQAFLRVTGEAPARDHEVRVALTLGVDPSAIKRFRQAAAKVSPEFWFDRDVTRCVLADGTARPLPLAEATRWLSRAEEYRTPVADWSAATPPGTSMLRVNGTWGVLRHLLTATGADPSAKWMKQAQALASEHGAEAVRAGLIGWLGQIQAEPVSARDLRDRHGYAHLTYLAAVLSSVRAAGFTADEAALLAHEESRAFPWAQTGNWVFAYGDKRRDRLPIQLGDTAATLAKGAVWMLSGLARPGDEGLLAHVARQLLFKPGGGMFRSLSAANACIWALGRMDTTEAVVAMSRLRRSVRDGRVSQSIDKAMRESAQRAGMTVAELEEIAVPDFGLDVDGTISSEIDGYVVTLRLADSDVAVDCLSPAGKALKTVPAAVKKHEDYKEIAEAAGEISRLLPLQKERIERLWLEGRSWDLATWRERYLDHPLVGTVARRLVWRFHTNESVIEAMWRDGGFVDAAGGRIDPDGEGVRVTLWHPVEAMADSVAAWRAYMMANRVRQPFKQAHREIYVLTDAERETEVYSNRFAAHILRQHQYMALAKTRGWSCRHRMRVDASNDEPTRIDLEPCGMWAEIFIRGAGGEDPEVLESGAYVYVTTDQVRFHRGQTVMRLDDVPPLVFSEVMRDCDLFCGVASIGADPTWINRGAEARRPNQWLREADIYWHGVSFDQMAEGARLRRDLVAEILPSMAIAPQCEMAEKYLRVKGRLRTYRIHFNSGNIIMEPDDRYLCIVTSSTPLDGTPIFIPFDGDRTLSIILSKAILLARDDKIKDPTILRQITPSG